MQKLTNEQRKSLYFTMKKIRMTEEKIESHYREDNMHTPIHLCIGQEAVAAGVCFNLNNDDKVYSNHRNHGHYLAKGGNLKKMIAELHNKETGCAGGYGGSMHMVDNSVGFPITSAIVAGGVPIGTGNALADKMQKKDAVTIVFLGDAATEEGVVYESIAFAVLKKLPVIYVCENNLYSVGTPMDKRESTDFLSNKFKGMLPVVSVDGNNVEEVQSISKEWIEKARNGDGPAFIECKTYRLRDHHDTKTGVEAGYQSQEEWNYWARKSPIEAIEMSLLNDNVLSKAEIESFEYKWNTELIEAFDFANASNLPDNNKMYDNLFA